MKKKGNNTYFKGYGCETKKKKVHLFAKINTNIINFYKILHSFVLILANQK